MKRISLWSIVFLLSVVTCFSVYQYVANGSMTEREDLLQATMWKISKSGHTELDVEWVQVKYNFFLGGRFPYETYVKMKNQPHVVIYGWSSEKKDKVEKVGITSH
ncbi:hypothetical protein [Bacillus sp. 179-C3.3 HS]|uniref:hypothetical protein n=1 Tax=Bacillus sp. 179-C3.3 HS TaxID=3232162 RepID=UPI0039A383F1